MRLVVAVAVTVVVVVANVDELLIRGPFSFQPIVSAALPQTSSRGINLWANPIAISVDVDLNNHTVNPISEDQVK